MKAGAAVTVACLGFALVACSESSNALGPKDALTRLLGDYPQIGQIVITSGEVAVVAVDSEGKTSSVVATPKWGEQDISSSESGGNPPYTKSDSVDVETLFSQVDDLNNSCDKNWQVKLTPATTKAAATEISCGEETRTFLNGTELSPISDVWSAESFKIIWDELKLLVSDGQVFSVLISADKITAKIPSDLAGEVINWQRGLAEPDSLSTQQSSAGKHYPVPLAQIDSATVWGLASNLSTQNGIPLGDESRVLVEGYPNGVHIHLSSPTSQANTEVEISR